MDRETEMVRQASESFDRILRHRSYTEVIKDDEQRNLLLEMVDGRSYKRILDIGTGTGYLAFPLARAYPYALVCGIDIARGIVEENQRRVRESCLNNLIFQTFDGITYPFGEKSFDLIVSRYAFHHFLNPGSAVEQIYRLLTPGGRVLISDPMRAREDLNGVIDAFMRVKRDGHVRFYEIQELEGLFAEKGLRKEKQIVTQMTFPFPSGKAYEELYEKITEEDRCVYGMAKEGEIVWVRHIKVGNTIFMKGE